MLKKAIVIFSLILLSTFKIASQLDIDSLIRISESQVHDTIKTKALLDISWELKASKPEVALKYAEKALDLSRKTVNKALEANALKNIGTIYLFLSEFPKSESYFIAAINLFKSLKNDKGLASCYNNLGLVNEQEGDFEKAMDFYQKSLEFNEKIKNLPGIASSQSNIGNVLQLQGNYRFAIDFYLKSLKIREEINDKLGIADTYNNIGSLYEKQGAFSQAEKNFEKALIIYVEIDDKRKSGLILHNLGSIQFQQKKYDKAMDYFEKSLEIKHSCDDKQGIASTYMSIGELYSSKDDISKAKEFFNKGYAIFNETGNQFRSLQAKIALAQISNKTQNFITTITEIEPLIKNGLLLPEDLKTAYDILSVAYFNLNNLNKAYNYQKLFIELKDSLGNEQNTKNIIQLQLDYEFQKKQKEIELDKEKQQLHSEKELNTRQMVIFILLICLMAFIVIAILIYRSYLIKRQDNRLLELQKKSIQEYNQKLIAYQEELLSQKEDLEVQKKTIMNQRDLLDEKNQRLSESIHYAKHIQTLLLPTENVFKNAFKDYFLLYKPKDIVSGDFYWYREVGNYIIIAAADCTGHGVPGAFMSLLSMSFLDEIVDSGIIVPSEILLAARGKIQKTLHGNAGVNDPRDGMDIGICTIDKNNKILQFSGAYHSLIILDSDASSNSETILTEINGDKIPIGSQIKKHLSYNLYSHPIKETDKFILYTDGFIDQFGGAYDRKFLPKKFKDILIETRNMEMKAQKESLVHSLEIWMDGREQIDDILVIGFQV
jgi:tetratricopeptide (TPR) repeat protein